MRLYTNAHLATFVDAGDLGIIRDASVVVDGGVIIWLGPSSQLPTEYQQQSGIDLDQCWLTPGFIDCHTHLVYAGSRYQEFSERLQGKSYQDIAAAGGGIQATVRATRQASEKQLLQLAQHRVATMMAEGVTTVEIKSGYGLDYQTEAKMLQVARKIADIMPISVRTSYLGAHALPPEYSGWDEYIEAIINDILPQLHLHGLVDAVDVYCESIACNQEQCQRVFEAAQSLGLPIKCHAEQFNDIGATELAASFRALSCDHLEYVSPAAITAMANADVVAVLLPGAYYFLQETQSPPVADIRQAGVEMAVASDCNPGSSPISSLRWMLNMACLQFGLSPLEALHGVTRVAAKALAMAETHGSLSVGKVADFAVWRIEHPYELCANLVTNPCQGTVVAGDWYPKST